jgi:uncharacterized protein with von Willebrand factor type A (vWA) domain
VFFSFFAELREAKVPVSLREYLTLMEAMERRVAAFDIEEFYFLARASLVKDERHLDRFDRVFGHCFKGIETLADPRAEIPEECLRKLAERFLSEEEKKLIQSLGGWEKLMETLRRRLAEQKARHQRGSKWIGTAGTSPFGAHGYNPEGVRIGQEEGRHRSAVKVWDRREFRNLDDTVELGARNIKLALRRLRQFAREGAAEELDLDADELIARGLPEDDVRRTIRLVDLAEYKRRQAPPGIRISTKAFGRDRRLPITNRYRG